MTRAEQIMNFVEAEYKKLALAIPEGLTPEGRGYLVALGDVIRFVDKLPRATEPQGLDEAAEEWVENNCFDCDYVGESRACDAFKAGAKWQAEQGVTVKGIIVDEMAYSGLQVEPIENNIFRPQEEVIVQIGKKE